MNTTRLLREYRKGEFRYYILSIELPFQGMISGLPESHSAGIDAESLLGSYLAFIKPKGEDWVEDIRIRSDPSVDRKNAGLADAHDTTLIAVTPEGEVAASFTIYSSVAEPQIGLVCHVRTHDEHRQRGLSSVLGDMSMTEWFSGSPGGILILHVTNPTAHRIYGRMGFKTLAGEIADKDVKPGEIMVYGGDDVQNPVNTLRNHYRQASRRVTERPLGRADIASFVALTASEGDLTISPEIPGMPDVCTAEDFFTMYVLKGGGDKQLSGLIDNHGLLAGVSIFSQATGGNSIFRPFFDRQDK